MSYKWNVYKVFKNGKRAKAPILEFESTEEEYMNYFQTEVKKNFTGKFMDDSYKIIRADLPQQRESEVVNEEEEKFSKEKNRVLAKLLRKSAGDIKRRSVSAGLVYCRDSNWNWQWAALEGGTSNYITGISPTFETHREAQEWIEKQISLNP